MSMSKSITDPELLQSDSPAAVTYRNALANAQIARQQYDAEKRQPLRQSNVGDHEQTVTAKQARHIAQGVHAIGTLLSNASGRNEYGGVYGCLYRQWGISNYKELPAAQYNDVITWLRNWYLELVDDNVPF